MNLESIVIDDSSTISEHENSWRLKFPKKTVLVLSIIQMIFTLAIFALEIASLTVIIGDSPTGVGIWCALPFAIASILTFILACQKDGSRVWASRVYIAQIILISFTCILVGLIGNYISINTASYELNLLDDATEEKFQIAQGELTCGVFLMFSGLVYIIIYICVTYIALWKPFHTIDINYLFHT